MTGDRRSARQGSYFDLTTADVAGDASQAARSTRSRQWAFPSSTASTKIRPSQHEIDLRHTDALTMADSRHDVSSGRVARSPRAKGCHATFMPKPLEGVQGSGMHTHMSLFRGDDNAFYDADDPYGLSPTAKAFMAGLLRPRRRDHRHHQPDGQQLQAA